MVREGEQEKGGHGTVDRRGVELGHPGPRSGFFMTSVVKVLGFFFFFLLAFGLPTRLLRDFLPARPMLRSTAQRTTQIQTPRITKVGPAATAGAFFLTKLDDETK